MALSIDPVEQRVGQRALDDGQLGEVLRGERGDEAGQPAGRAEVDGFDVGVRVGAARDGHGKRTLQSDVVDVGVAASDELGVLDALERTADVRSGHGWAARWYHVVSRRPRQPAALGLSCRPWT